MLPFHLISLDAINAWFQNHMEIAGVVIILATAGESVPLIGLVIPGTALMVAVLGLLSLGLVDFWTLFAWLTIGAILGDSIAYHLGRHYAAPIQRLMTRYMPVKAGKDKRGAEGATPQRSARQRAEDLLNNHGMWAIGLSRFIPVLRAFVPALAGVGKMPWHKFYIANVVSAVIWVVVHLGAGELFNRLLFWLR